VAGSAPSDGHETDGFRRLPGRGFPRGAIFHVPRRESEQTHFALRLRELSRNPDAYGTELPVVHEKDFVGPRMSLYDVPVGPSVRSKLRLYSLNPPEGEEGEVWVTFSRAGTNRYVLSWLLSWTRPPCTYESCMPAYAELDLDTLSWNPEMRAGGRFDLSFWTTYAGLGVHHRGGQRDAGRVGGIAAVGSGEKRSMSTAGLASFIASDPVERHRPPAS
jgi:hypothetical protein